MKKVYLTLILSLIYIFANAQDSSILPEQITITLSPEDITQGWIKTVSIVLGIITIGASIVVSLYDYRLKLRAETRLANNASVESDINLMKAYTELIALAHARKSHHVSDELLLKAFDKIYDANKDDFVKVKQQLHDLAIIIVPAGTAEQSAFVASITELAKKHKMLENPTIQALETMKSFIPELAEKYLKELEEYLDKKNSK